MRLVSVVSVLVGLCLLAGCGGGGGNGNGGGPGLGAFSYSTDWSGATANSQVVTLINSSGGTVTSRVLNRSIPDTGFDIPNLPAGRYRLDADLFSAADGGGANLGEINAYFDVNGSTVVFRTRASGAAAGAQATPTSAAVPLNGSGSFAGHLVAAGGEALFSAPGSFAYSVIGSIGTVDASGLFTPTTAGSGTVRATHVPTSLRGSANVTVTNVNVVRGKWTVLVFMNAANDLFTFSTLNMNQMEEVAGNPDVRFVVQWKQSREVQPQSSFNGTRRVLVKPDTSGQVVSDVIQDLGPNVDMGDWRELQEFINWGKEFYPADRYCIVIWNHGNGWLRSARETTRAVSFDDVTGNSIQLDELRLALGANRYDMVAFDASLMQMVEAAYEISDQAVTVIGSEESPPGEGYPYDDVFREFRDNPTLGTRALSRNFVTAMVNNPPYAGRKITQSVVDTSKLDNVASALDLLAADLIANLGTMTPAIQSARNTSQSYSPTISRYFRDIYDLCDKLKAHASTPEFIRTRCTAVQTALTDAIVHEGHNAQSPNSHGLSVDFSPSSFFTVVQGEYARFKFSADTRWDEFLRVAP